MFEIFFSSFYPQLRWWWWCLKKFDKHSLDDDKFWQRRKSIMAYVTGSTESLPFMDRLSHSIIKETSKSLSVQISSPTSFPSIESFSRHLENIISMWNVASRPSFSVPALQPGMLCRSKPYVDPLEKRMFLHAVPFQRFLYGTAKEYPPLYASCHTDSDVKTCLRSIQQQQRNSHVSFSLPFSKRRWWVFFSRDRPMI